jgi:hypothetical protein
MRPHFGLGQAEHIALLRITWPDGSSTELGGEQLAGRINTTLRVEQGKGLQDAEPGLLAKVALSTAGGGEQ